MYFSACKYVIGSIKFKFTNVCPKGQLCNFKMSFGCHCLDQKTNKIFLRISATASKNRSDKKNKGTLYH